MAIDVVCQMEVDEEKSQIPTVVYEGEEYYFCSNLCMVSFKANPEKYIEEFREGKVHKVHKGKGNPQSQ